MSQLDLSRGIIDTHVHCDFGADGIPGDHVENTPDQLSAACAKSGVVAIITDTAQPDLNGIRQSRVPTFRYEVVGRAGFNVASIENRLKLGLSVGIKINSGFIDLAPDDPRLVPLYRLAATFDVPVVMHTGDPGWAGARLRFCHPLVIDDIAMANRETTFVMMHAGNPWFTDAGVVAAKNPNVYMDVSGIIEGSVLGKSSESIEILVKRPIEWLAAYLGRDDKILFGSGWPGVDMGEYGSLVQSALPSGWWDSVSRLNAIRLFRLLQRSPAT